MRASRHRSLLLLALGVLCLAAVAIATLVGAERTSVADLFGALGLPAGNPMGSAILREVRLPRVLLAALVGAALALSGATMQALFRNPMADPYLLGVSAGGALGAAVAMLIQERIPIGPLIPLCSGAGALATVWLVHSLSRRGGGIDSTTLLLTGMMVSTLMMAMLAFLVIHGSNDQTVFHMRMQAWMLGGLDRTVGLRQPLLAAPYIIVCSLLLLRHAHDFNVMLTPDEVAHSLGLDLERTQRIAIALASLLAASAVCMAGIIGFVGLVAPHAARLLVGPDHRWLLPGSVLGGAMFLVVCDALARSAAPPTEFPVGIFSALLGVPVFLILLRRSRWKC